MGKFSRKTEGGKRGVSYFVLTSVDEGMYCGISDKLSPAQSYALMDLMKLNVQEPETSPGRVNASHSRTLINNMKVVRGFPILPFSVTKINEIKRFNK